MNVNRVFLYLSARWQLVTIFVLAFAIRITLALISDNFNHPDENFQIMEQAHRLIFGYGIVPWEYRFAARSWLIPGFMAAFLYPFKLLGLDNPNIYIPGVKVLFAVLSLTVVWAAYRIGKNLISERAGLLAAFVCAVWYEIVYFSIRPLSEVWAVIFFMAALALSFGNKKRQIILSAIFTVMVAAIRINYIPISILLSAINYKESSPENKRIYLSASFIMIILIGIFESATLGKPYISYFHFFNMDRSFFMAGAVGSVISFAYLWNLAYASFFIYWLIPVAGLILYRRIKILLALVTISLLTHLLIPAQNHQIDYRHTYIVIPIIMIIGAVIMAELTTKIKSILWRKTTLAGISIALVGLSLAGALTVIPGQSQVYKNKTIEVYRHDIFFRDPHLSAYRYLNECSDLAGLYDISELWFRSGGYYYLHHDIPIYYSNTAPPNFDYVSHILSRENLPASSGFELIKQYDEYKIYARINKDFQYKRDINFTKNILQPGIDDRFKSKI